MDRSFQNYNAQQNKWMNMEMESSSTSSVPAFCEIAEKYESNHMVGFCQQHHNHIHQSDDQYHEDHHHLLFSELLEEYQDAHVNYLHHQIRNIDHQFCCSYGSNYEKHFNKFSKSFENLPKRPPVVLSSSHCNHDEDEEDGLDHQAQGHVHNSWSNSEKVYSKSNNGDMVVSAANSASPKTESKSTKQRIRWTPDLHERFVECVNCLGGAEKATPRAILKLMDSNMLTILHVKSHLQKYRTSKYIPESTQGKYEKSTITNDTHDLDMKTELQQIKEAMRQVNMHLHDQLETQQKLQLMLEEQGRQLITIFGKQQNSQA